MYQISDPKRTYLAAFTLGACALVGNSLALPLMVDSYVPVGNLFLFIGAASLGLNATLVACAIALFPFIMIPGGTFEVLRVLCTCVGLCFATERAPRVPSFAIVMALWIVIFAPCLYFGAGSISVPLNIAHWGVSFYALHETLLVMLSGALLLNSEIWFQLTGRPRHTPLYLFTTHIFTMVSAICVFTTLFALGKGHRADSLILAFDPTLMIVIMCMLAIAGFAGYFFSSLLERDFQKFFHSKLSSMGSGNTFSGLASDYWRRKTSATNGTSPAGNTEQSRSNSKTDLVNSDKGVCALASDGTVTFANRRFRELANLQGSEITGKQLASLNLSVELKRGVSALTSQLEKNGPRVLEFRVNQIPDKLRFFELTILSPEAYENSSINTGPGGSILTLREITDRRTVEEQLLKAQKLQSLGKVISGLGHAFNNSLTTIIGHASVAKHSKDAKLIGKSLDGVLESSQAAGELVRKLLDFAEGEPSTMRVEDLKNEVSSHLGLLQKMIGDEFQLSFKGSHTPISINCDNALLTQALTNLVLNSKEAYGNKPGRIEIELDKEEFDGDVGFLDGGAHAGEFARIRVRDFGVGMSRETLARAFDPLFTTKSNSGHTGLGLSIVYAIVRAHDGFLAAESRPDTGTMITLYIPVHSGAVDRRVSACLESPVRGATLPTSIKGQAERILVVEDEPVVRDLVGKMLKRLGYNVATCANGVEALEQNARTNFDLILVDMIMPHMDGLELIDRLKAISHSQKTLVMSGYGVASVDRSSDPILPKPFDIETLAQAVRLVLDRPRTDNTDTSQFSASL